MSATVPRGFPTAWGDLGLIRGSLTLSGGAGLGGLGPWCALRNGLGGLLGAPEVVFVDAWLPGSPYDTILSTSEIKIVLIPSLQSR